MIHIDGKDLEFAIDDKIFLMKVPLSRDQYPTQDESNCSICDKNFKKKKLKHAHW